MYLVCVAHTFKCIRMNTKVLCMSQPAFSCAQTMEACFELLETYCWTVVFFLTLCVFSPNVQHCLGFYIREGQVTAETGIQPTWLSFQL